MIERAGAASIGGKLCPGVGLLGGGVAQDAAGCGFGLAVGGIAWAFHAFFEYAIAAIVILFTAAGARLIEPGGNYTDLLRLLTTLFALVYSKNIIRNFKKIQPDNEFIAVLDIIINTKYLDFIKHLKNGNCSYASRLRNRGDVRRINNNRLVYFASSAYAS